MYIHVSNKTLIFFASTNEKFLSNLNSITCKKLDWRTTLYKCFVHY